MKIGLDLDDVIADLSPVILDFIREVKGLDVPDSSIEDFFSATPFGVDATTLTAWARELFLGPYNERIKPMKGVLAVLNEWKGVHDVTIITSRHSSTEEPTSRWITNNLNGAVQDVQFVGRLDSVLRSPDRKALLCKELGITLFVEDNPHFVTCLADAGIRTLIFDRPWNRTFHREHVDRVHSWDQIRKIIREE